MRNRFFGCQSRYFVAITASSPFLALVNCFSSFTLSLAKGKGPAAAIEVPLYPI
ncbi:hypothetical protein LAY57_12565 [Argonema antarcticum A004/B2]|nr:hypothetical protein [Argonema antarcticum A004/B2]